MEYFHWQLLQLNVLVLAFPSDFTWETERGGLQHWQLSPSNHFPGFTP